VLLCWESPKVQLWDHYYYIFLKAVFEFLIEYCDSTVSTDGCLSDTILMHLKYTYQIFVGIGCFASQLICH
jgi:hypothetical protein